MSTALRVPGDLQLLDPDAAPVPLSDLLTTRFTLVQLVRYFGCLPCQQWLIALDQATPRLAELDVSAIAVGGSADYQARWLRDDQRVRLPLLLDPEHRFRSAVQATKPLGLRVFDPRGAAAYARAVRGGLPPQGLTRDAVRVPGVVLLDQQGIVRWRYLGNRVGDYPHLGLVLRTLQKLT